MGMRMSGSPSWALREPSTNSTSEWTRLWGWMSDVDPLVGHIVQPARLDDLQALVHERRRVDGDLGAHVPGRVRQGVARAWPSRGAPPASRGTARPRRSGCSRATVAASLAAEALPERRVLGVDGSDPGQRAGQRVGRVVARRPRPRVPGRAASPGGRRRRASPCSRSRRPCRPRSAASTGRRLTMPPVATMTRSTSSRRRDIARARRGSPVDARPGGSVEAGAAASASASATTAGRSVCACSPNVATSRPAARATTWNASGPAARCTSSVWRPIEPVEPSSATPTGRAGSGRPVRSPSGRRR